jgi:hypothetical protein
MVAAASNLGGVAAAVAGLGAAFDGRARRVAFRSGAALAGFDGSPAASVTGSVVVAADSVGAA